MPELITAAIAAPSPKGASGPSHSSAYGTKGPNGSDGPNGPESSGPAGKTSETNSSATGSSPQSSGDPFSAVLKKQMAKNDGTENASAAQAMPVVRDSEAAAAEATAAVLAALTTDFAAKLPRVPSDEENSVDASAGELALLGAQTTESLLISGPIPVAAQLLAGNGGKVDAEPRGPVAASLKEALFPTDGKIALEAAISADASSTPADHVDAKFQILLDSRAQQAQAPLTQASSQASSAPILKIDTPAGQAGWSEEMGQKLTWMATNTRQQADLVLTPPSLGRIEVSLTINGDQATAVFGSSNASVRDMIENSMPRLREILAESGIDLGQTHVGSESAHQSADNKHGEQSAANDRFPGKPLVSEQIEANSSVMRASNGRGMVDIFA